MKRDEFSALVKKAVELYIGSFERFDSNPQLKINPVTLTVQLINGSEMLTDIDYSDTVIEEAAAADDPDNEDAMDRQSARNPDFYAVKSLMTKDSGGRAVPDPEAIASVVSVYFSDQA